MASVSFPARLAALAAVEPDRLAVTCADGTLTRGELEVAATSRAHEFADHGVGTGDLVTLVLPNERAWFVNLVATWKVGATPQPLGARTPAAELAAILAVASPRAAVADRDDVAGLPVLPPWPATTARAPLPDATSPSWKAPTSGGSTGSPKVILSGDAALLSEDRWPANELHMRSGGCLVMPGPLYHNGPMIWAAWSLLSGSHVVALERFDAAATLAAIATYRADAVYLVPTMMRRIWALPEDVRTRFDLSSLEVAWHLAEPCPAWLKRAWIDWLGPERIYEMYGGTEGLLTTIISGVEWLSHPGSVGRPVTGEIEICDETGSVLPVGTDGEVWLRTARRRPAYHYLGASPRARAGGWESLGDIGHVDADGYLYLGDRSADMVLVGGANVYPAEVEGVLLEHADVLSCAVIGLPDHDKGNRVHAIVEAAAGTTTEELLTFCRARLSPYKCPRTVEFVDHALRDDAGKVRRVALREARLTAAASLAEQNSHTASDP